jgi:mRNA interferase RelE/StbE
MASFSIVFKPSVEKDLRKLPRSTVLRILDRAEALKDDPFPRQCTKLAGAEGMYRIRIGDYRVVYNVDKSHRLLTVHYIRHRRDIYRGL